MAAKVTVENRLKRAGAGATPLFRGRAAQKFLGSLSPSGTKKLCRSFSTVTQSTDEVLSLIAA